MRNIAEIGSHIDLQNIIIHKLNKVVGGETTLKCASDVLPITDIEKKFVGRVTESYQKNLLQHMVYLMMMHRILKMNYPN